ncbi:hypothetical protein ABEB36_008958 [Hypothenemus hampei]|uniref:Uncharacterized protein n=1 Tax=Hypothenemus hampei TaxID=57062 RepID=A0ABD1ENN7_HYPHA
MDTLLSDPSLGILDSQQLLPPEIPSNIEDDYDPQDDESITSEKSTVSHSDKDPKRKLNKLIEKLKKNINRTRCLDCTKLHRHAANNPIDMENNKALIDQITKHLNITHGNRKTNKNINKNRKLEPPKYQNL